LDYRLILFPAFELICFLIALRLSLVFPAHILNAESEYGKVPLPHLQKQYGELGVNMGS
jgi:hypothetical protein